MILVKVREESLFFPFLGGGGKGGMGKGEKEKGKRKKEKGTRDGDGYTRQSRLSPACRAKSRTLVPGRRRE